MGAGAITPVMEVLLGWTEVADRLSRWGDAPARTEEDAIATFGVGLETLRRIRCGEIEPDAALMRRILGAVPSAAPVPTFALHRGPAGRRLLMFLGDDAHGYTIDQAQAMHAELGDLLEIHADPRRCSR